MSFIAMVETTCVDRGVVTNSRSKQAGNRPNGLLERLSDVHCQNQKVD
jgi:hypothetical protein